MGVETMRPKRLVLATLLVTMLLGSLGSVTLAQTTRDNARDAVRRGNQEYTKANYELAIEEYRRVPFDADETYAKALYNIGVCYYELWKTEEAVAYYRRAVEARKGRYPAALHALGVALKDLGRLTEARKAFAQSIVMSDGNHAPAHFMLGLLAMGASDHAGAAVHFRQAIDRFNRRFPAGHNNLGVALAKMNLLQEAKLEFETALLQADGEFSEATENLKLCSSLLAPTPKTIASLKVVQVPNRFSK